MKPPQLQGTIVAHLRAAGTPQTSRDLAARFLLIKGADEGTCRRLIAPLLAEVRGVVHDPAAGWRFDPRAPARPAHAAEVSAAGVSGADAHAAEAPAAGAPAADAEEGVHAMSAGAGGAAAATGNPEVVPLPGADWNDAAGPQSLRDFVAVAVDGVGPAGSGAPRALTFLPVLEGEELQEEHLPAWGLDSDGIPAGDDGDDLDRTVAARRGASAGLTGAEIGDLAEAVGDLPVVAHRAAREVEPLRRLAETAGVTFHPRVFSAARLGHLLCGLKANHAAADLAQALGVEAPGPDDCRGRARLVARSWLRLVPLLEEKGILTVDAALEFQDLPAAPLDLSGYAFTAEDLRALPAAPGVYRFIDREGQVIYIGKARNLRSRVGSYFVPSARGTAKGRAILDRVHRLACDLVGSELEALLLEAALLQEHRPPLNRQFEVHERPAPYGPRRNLVVVLPDATAPTCALHLLRDGRYVRRIAAIAPAGFTPEGGVTPLLDEVYFGPAASAGEAIDIDWQLVASFLRRHRDAVNVLDMDECATAADAAARLRVLGEAALTGSGRVVAR